MDRHKYVKVAYHGFQEISRKDRASIYGTGLSRESFDEPDYALIDTLFSLGEAYLFAQLVELGDASPEKLPSFSEYNILSCSTQRVAFQVVWNVSYLNDQYSAVGFDTWYFKCRHRLPMTGLTGDSMQLFPNVCSCSGSGWLVPPRWYPEGSCCQQSWNVRFFRVHLKPRMNVLVELVMYMLICVTDSSLYCHHAQLKS